jgi:hypothetical protein
MMGMVIQHRRCDSLAIVILHLLGDVANAAELALTHYLPLTLTEPYLQNSSLGPPYHKWALFTNDDFQIVDQCVQRLVPVAWKLYQDAARDLLFSENLHRSGFRPITMKHAWTWFDVVNSDYVCCRINAADPVLTVSALNVKSWLNLPAESRVESRSAQPSDQIDVLPTLVKSSWPISDRATVKELQAVGLTRLNEMRGTILRFGSWITANCTLEQLIAPHKGTFSDDARYWHRPDIRY